ncbi:MAG: HAMP domain-containing histidine kinase [Candidatus Dormibacteraeota bacterium]|nr:HAMP domain-containing histidine kinase [Candidatus Dormibacteraeota bacterium]
MESPAVGSASSKTPASAAFLHLKVRNHDDRALARQRARQACRHLGVEPRRAARFGVALTEVLGACEEAAPTLSFALELVAAERWLVARARVPRLSRQRFEARLAPEPGALPPGLEVGRLVDLWQLSREGRDLVAELHLEVPAAGDGPNHEALAERLAEESIHDASVECERQHGELLQVVGELFRKEVEVARLGVELEETTRGVDALHAELDEAARLERMKSDFLNLASHELRGPIAVLRGYTSMLEDGSLGALTDSMRAVVPVMTAKLREMNLLINQMLETARLDDSRLVLSRERLDLGDVLQEAAAQMRPIAGGHHQLLVDRGSKRISVEGDRNRLTTIVTNLIDNAIKYSPQGGAVRCRLRAGRGRAMLSVADSGIGIENEELPRLFTRFGRLAKAENSQIPGTGLGLYLSRELARLHGGDIAVASKPGKGSTFTVLLPAAGTG